MNMRRALLCVISVMVAGAGTSCGSSTEPGTVTKAPRGDNTPPDITNVLAPAPFELVYFDTLQITFQVSDAGGVQLVTAERQVFADAPNADVIDTIQLDGKVSGTETVRFAGPQMALHPPAAQITIHAVDLAGNKRDSTFWVSFASPPSLAGGITYKGQSTAVVPGDTVDLQVSASDRTAIEWLGYRIGAPVNVADSVAVTGASATHAFQFVVTRDWLQPTGLPITYFARNSLGDFATGSTTANVIDAVRRTATRVPLHGNVTDAAFDTKRNVLYLPQPDSDRVLVFSLATNTFGTPIPIAGGPNGLDLSLSGDSLFIALRRAAAIGIIDLNGGARSQVPIPVKAGIGEGAEKVRVAANGLAIVTMAANSAITPSGIFEFDPVFQTVLPRTEPGSIAPYTTGAAVLRSADRQKVLIAMNPPGGSALYDAASNDFIVSSHQELGWLSTTVHGDRFLYGSLLFDGSLNLIRQVASPLGGATVLSGDGLVAYFGNSYGYEAFRTADDVVIEHVVSAPFVGRLLLTPAGDRLISITESELILESLGTSP
jgi:hypothetical protein